MAWTVGEVAKLAKVSVRTLHHYDAVGLLGPSGRTPAGYRLYEMPELERLQQVLFFRELGLALPEIREVMLDPAFDRAAALRAQRELIAEKAERTAAMLGKIDEALQALEEGTPMDEKDMFDVFTEYDPKEIWDEVQDRWGDTDAYKESVRRYRKMSKDDLAQVMTEGDEIEAAFAEQLDAGAAPSDPEVQELVERHRLHIEAWYPCSKEMHANLGRMYVSDPRFAAHYDDRREGLAKFVSEAIVAAEDAC
jgi:MerR family transcriptional regulator, thiopeptide resistance regulator